MSYIESFLRHSRMYYYYLKTFLKTRLVYQEDFLLGLSNQFFSILSSLGLIALIFTQIESLNGWGFYEMIFLLGTARFIMHFHTTFLFAPVFLGEQYIIRGTIDRYKVRPLNVLFQVYSSRANLHNFGDAVASLGIMAFAASKLSIKFLTPTKMIYAIVAVLNSVMILASIFLVLGSLAFWTGRSRSFFTLLWDFKKFTKYPFSVYPGPVRILFMTAVPLAFASFFPASFALERFRWIEWQLFNLVAGPLFFLIAYQFWRYGLQNYTSTGS